MTHTEDQAKENRRLQQADDEARSEERQGATRDDTGQEDCQTAAGGAVQGQGIPGRNTERIR